VFSQFLNFEESWGCPDVNCNRVKEQNVITGDFVFDNATSLAYIINKGETRNCNGRIGDFQYNSEKIRVEFNFPHNDPLPLIKFTLHINVADGRTAEVIPLEQHYLDYKYRLFAYTLNKGEHYLTVLCQGSSKFVYDGLSSNSLKTYKQDETHLLSTLVYIMDQ